MKTQPNARNFGMNRVVLRRFLSMSGPIEWNVIVYDKPGVDRTAVRPEHFQNIAPTVNAGIVKAAGAIYHDVERTKFAGSSYHLVANSKEEIVEFLKKNIYYTAGIWDVENIIANPIGVAVRLPKVLDGVDSKFYETK